MTRTRLFRSNRSQALRLPKDVAFPESVREVRIVKRGALRIVAPADSLWDDFFERPGFDWPDRDQPAAQDRDPL